MNIIGIDPGLSGAVALLSQGTNVVSAFDMPTFEITVNRKKKRQLALTELVRSLRALVLDWGDAPDRFHAFIEDPNASPGAGVTSMFNFGFNCGAAQMAIAGSSIPYTLVKPNVWKKALGLTQDKDASRRLASRLFPQAAHLWSRVKDDGRAEAVLLAHYGRTVLA